VNFLIKGEKTLFIEELVEADTDADALEIFHSGDHSESIVSESEVEIFEIVECP
jgi:hypothetical protein